MNRWSALVLLLAMLGALFLRTPHLGNRPLHNDEAVNATKLAALWEKGDYKYDPHEYHGPTLHYFSLPFLWLSGASDLGSSRREGAQTEIQNSQSLLTSAATTITDAQLRIVTVAFGVGLILLLVLFRDGLGRPATIWAAIFLAVSPAMVFYSRYFIHEMLLVFFTLLTLAAGWRYVQSRKAIWAGLTGAGVGLMFATKETFVLTLAAMCFALIATRLWNHWRLQRAGAPASGTARIKTTPQPARAGAGAPKLHIALALGTAALIWLVSFTSFFTNAAGLLDSFKTYLPWLSRAGGNSPHINPWYFYFERLLWFHPSKSPPWTEATILILALIGAAPGFCGNRSRVAAPGFVRFLSFFTIALTGIYTVIAYKTPWCALNFWLGMILLAGVGAGVLVDSFRDRLTRSLMLGLIGAGALHLGVQSWLLTRDFPADLRNPYVYAQTSPHARELIARVKAIGRVAPEGFATVMKVISPESYWPLPWALREFKNVGWYDELPGDPYAPIILTSAKLGAALDDKSDKRWIMTGYYELRPNVFLELYVERGLWEKFVATLPRDVD
jgi:uncharacterized protein (TIGR03663 family)